LLFDICAVVPWLGKLISQAAAPAGHSIIDAMKALSTFKAVVDVILAWLPLRWS
jgi:hypothetical protein